MEIDQEYELVPVGQIQEHPQNPRRGDVGLIAESVDVNGWYGACTVQRSTGYILAGNHRYRVAVAKGAEVVPVIWRDVDDETAVRILLADNATADAGTYDEDVLQALMDGLEDLAGTGLAGRALRAAEEALEASEPEGDAQGDGEAAEVPPDAYTPMYGVIVVCRDEPNQKEVYEWLAGHSAELGGLIEGAEIRVVAV